MPEREEEEWVKQMFLHSQAEHPPLPEKHSDRRTLILRGTKEAGKSMKPEA